ncbi:hypothetical protein AMK59_3957, partial [Oryctes borbonicus]
ENVPEIVQEAVLKKTVATSLLNEKVAGYDWNNGLDFNKLLDSYRCSGFQATNFGLAVEEINKMIACRQQPIPQDKYNDSEDQFTQINNNCTIFLGYTSNIVSSGLRETIKFLVQHKMIDCIVTTAGGIEEDFIKCFLPTYLGNFHLDGKMLRENGINRIGNLLVPNDNYCKFEDWIMPILDEMCTEQKEKGIVWTPSKMIQRLGDRINNEESIYYWAAKNNIPVFCPALTDGSLGDMMFFHSFKNPGLVLDILHDLRRLNLMAIKSVNTGIIIIGGGLVKHHICNANLMVSIDFDIQG